MCAHVLCDMCAHVLFQDPLFMYYTHANVKINGVTTIMMNNKSKSCSLLLLLYTFKN